MKAYLDSSSFCKRFVEEDGSDGAETTCSQASRLGLSILCVPEIVSALSRRKRERMLTAGQYDEAKRRLDEITDWSDVDRYVNAGDGSTE